MKLIRESILGGSAALVGYLHEPTPEIPDRTRRPAVLVCPGGAYEFRSDREADPPAFVFFARGYHVFILRYTTGPGKACGMQPLRELSEYVVDGETAGTGGTTPGGSDNEDEEGGSPL